MSEPVDRRPLGEALAPATMTAALIGVSAGGVVGALLAVPVVAAVKAAYLELRPATQKRGASAKTDETEADG